MSEFVRVERRGHVLWVTIDREDRRNAMNGAVLEQLAAAFARAASEPDLRAVVLTGAGERAFSAGFDLSDDAKSFEYDFAKVGLPFVHLLKQGRDLNVPVIARINGHCLAGGMGLLGICDLAVSVDHARFGLPEVRVGVFPMQVMSVLQHLVPRRALYELALTGEPITAAEAKEIGLLNHVVAKGELDAKVEWLLERLIDKSPTAIRRGKYAMRHTESMTFDQAIAFLEAQVTILSRTEDAAEGRSAFNEKRSPTWTGR